MDTSALRDFAFKKLQEARERGTELAAVTAARAASSISSVPSSSFVFRQNAATQQEQQPIPLDKKLETLKSSNDSLRAALTGRSSDLLDESIYKLDLINESLAFTIENIQEGSHVMKLLSRQLKDSAAMKNSTHKTFYQREQKT
ncbi:hypothetical protein PHMEG_00011302 [Phytophthora megakarya]|uniref:Uncharacterized protein n=1 Tax=Phytophthora megakarya TaxID=4795 RepID=A0A225WE35_9STRA|nr:hypothetical protein PHMEG_00011302 [Phytophthora megakarya]